MEIIFIFFINTCFIVWTAYIDADHINKQQYIDDHSPRVWQRGCFYACIFIYNLQIGLGSFLMYVALFDIAINYFTNKDIFYLGTVAKWDNFWGKIKPFYIVFKVICLIIGIMLFLPEKHL